MIQAEECIIEHPDSALAYLSSLEKEIKGEPKETQMYYYLLTIKATDKLYIYHRKGEMFIQLSLERVFGWGCFMKIMVIMIS